MGSYMSIDIKPKFISTVEDDPESAADGMVTPSRWNLGSTMVSAEGVMVGRVSPGTGEVEELDPVDVKTLLALGNVDNTSDAAKPVSTATQTALDLKLDNDGDNSLAEISPGYYANGTVPTDNGFFKDDDPTTQIHRFRDRIFFGDGAEHTGRRTGELGGTWLTERGANYFEKNAQIIALSTQPGGRIAFLGASHTEVGEASTVNIGVAGISVNEGEASTGRGGYFEGMHKGNATATLGIEIQVGNYTATDISPNPYNLQGGAIGVFLGAESGYGYTTGDDLTPITAPTHPSSVGIAFASGSHQESYQRFRAGIIFTNNALFRGADGLTGAASAIMLSSQHEIEWQAAAGVTGALIRSDVNSASQEVGLIFKNSRIHFVGGASEIDVATLTAQASAVNYFDIKNAATTASPILQATGSDTNVGLSLVAKGQGQVRIQSHDGSATNLYVLTTASAPVNGVSVTGSGAAAPVQIGAAGSDTNIDILLSPKGSGVLRLGTHAAIAAETITGYITIKDAGGTTRKLAVVS